MTNSFKVYPNLIGNLTLSALQILKVCWLWVFVKYLLF